MSRFLLTATPIYGHVAPMLAIGRELIRRGHRVSLLTGRKYAAATAAAGLDWLPLPSAADYDDARIEDWLPPRARSGRIAEGRHSIIGVFIRPLAAQHAALTAALDRHPYDAVLCETAFLGALPLLLAPVQPDLAILGVSVTPLSLVSVDCAPFGPGFAPGGTRWHRRRNRDIQWLLEHGPLRPVQTALDNALAPFDVPPGRLNYFDVAGAFSTTFHLAPSGLEYPRRELPGPLRFVGPVWSEPLTPEALPDWWADLAGPRPVVHVTQGTIDNLDPGKLLVPAIRGLRNEDVLVVACTGGRPVRELVDRLATVPDNVRIAEFLPYDRLLPQVDVMITNGGFGGVQRALAHGIPLVVAGRTEDKPEVAGRVAWSGTGVNLRFGRPTPHRIRRAVRRVLRDPAHRRAAERVRAEIAALGDPTVVIADALEQSATAHRRVAGAQGRARRA